MGLLSSGVIVALTIGLITAMALLILSYLYGRELTNNVTTRGANGVQSTKINLSCPSGQVISFKNTNPTITRAALICSGDAGCDGFWSTAGQNTNFFSSNIIDLLGDNSPISDLKVCSSQNSCSFTVPDATDSRIPSQSCLKGCKGQLQLISTYDCVAAS